MSISHLSRRLTDPQWVNDSGYIIPATTAAMIHAVYRYPFNAGIAPKPIARHTVAPTAPDLYNTGDCIKIPASKTTSAATQAIKQNWEIFFIWKYWVAGYRFQVTGKTNTGTENLTAPKSL